MTTYNVAIVDDDDHREIVKVRAESQEKAIELAEDRYGQNHPDASGWQAYAIQSGRIAGWTQI